MSRASPRLPVRHGLALAVAGLVLFAACEESELLTPSGEPAFTAISFDRATLEPEEAPLQSPLFFTAGPTQLDYSAVVNYQRTSKEVQEQGDADISYFIETFDSLLFTTPEGDKFVSFEWEGDVAEGFGEAQGATGSVQFTGKFTFPTVSTLCGSYKYARAIAVLEPELSTAYRDQAVYKIKGVPTVGEIGSCAYAFADRRDAAFAQKFYGFAFPTGPTGPSLQLRWGEPLWVYGRFFPVPRQGDPFPVGLEFGPRPGTVFPLVFREGKFSDVLAWVPVGAVSGSPRVLVSGRETKYGGNIKPSVSITPGDDYFEPNNQFGQGSTALLGELDPAFRGLFFAFNPSLSLPAGDRTPLAHPSRGAGWGAGDWFKLTMPAAGSVCFAVTIGDPNDDVDLFVFDQNRNEIGRSFNAAGVDEYIQLGGLAAGTSLFIWVAPFLADIVTPAAGYAYSAGDCALVGPPPAKLGSSLARVAAATQAIPPARKPSSLGNHVW